MGLGSDLTSPQPREIAMASEELHSPRWASRPLLSEFEIK